MYLNPTDLLMGLLGGLLIGGSSALLLLANGRIAGISGILGGLLARLPVSGAGENIAFLAGLIGAPALYALAFGAPDIGITSSIPLLVIAGLLVGFGTRMGSGCTSGHGVCGISRFSLRSITATLTFMAVAAIIVAGLRHWIGG